MLLFAVLLSYGFLATPAEAQLTEAQKSTLDQLKKLTPQFESGAFRIIMTRCANDWSAYRFNAQTGETWWPDTEKDPVWVWKKMTDDDTLPVSDYDVQGVFLLHNDKKFEEVVRIDRRSGRSWQLRSGKWHEFDEGPEFAQSTPPQSGFQLQIVASATHWCVFRFNPENGETWTIPPKVLRRVWQKVPDPQPLPAGDYALQGIFDKDGDSGEASVFRIDRRNGRTWIAFDNWTVFGETSGFTGVPGPVDGYRLTMHATPAFWNIYRFNPETGSTWLPYTEDGKTAWQWIADRSGLFRGDYEVRVVHWVEDERLKYGVVRIERKTGRLWFCWDDSTWDEVAEESDFANREVPRDGYRLVTANSKLDWYALRYNPENGETWAADKQDDQWVAARWVDRLGLPNTGHEVGMVAFVDQGQGTENVYRLDIRTGSAQVYNQKWQPIESEKVPLLMPPKPGYQLYLCAQPSGCQPFRFDSKTGAAWTPTPDQVMTWGRIVDPVKLSDDNYQLNAVSWLGSDKATYTAVLRTSLTTGRSWYVRGLRWFPIHEPQ